MHEPDGYPAANDAVLAAARRLRGPPGGACAHRSERRGRAGRGAPLPRRRAPRGFKLHPRSDAFGLPHPVVEEVVALAHERRAPVLFHAGRGIPHLGEAVVDLARRYPGARLILAHAGISDLGWIADDAAVLHNLFFDTAWWNVADQLQLYATIPPGRILYASDMPYAPGPAGRLRLPARRRARSATGPSVLRSIAGRAAGARGGRGGARSTSGRRRARTPWAGASSRPSAWSPTARRGLQIAFRGLDPSEPIALARLACRTCRDGDVARAAGLRRRAAGDRPGERGRAPRRALRDHARRRCWRWCSRARPEAGLPSVTV